MTANEIEACRSLIQRPFDGETLEGDDQKLVAHLNALCDLAVVGLAHVALTEAEIAEIEKVVVGPGFGPWSDNIYCHVCGQNVKYACLPSCAWAKAKKILRGKG